MSKTALSLAARRSADSHPRCAGPLLSALRRPYSNKNRMKSVSWVVSSVTQTQSYSINALGQRLKKTKAAGTAPQATVHFTYDEAGRLTGEYNANNQLVQEVLWLDDMPLATLRPRAGQTLQTIGATGQLSGSTVHVIDAFHIHTDHLNTPRVITRPSDNKKVWEWVNSEPFGNNPPNENPQAIGTFTFNLAFPGQYRDKETGLNYNYFRDYNPQTGRYVQSDPIGLRGGINTFGYADDPLREIDPKGLKGIRCIWGSCDEEPIPPGGHDPRNPIGSPYGPSGGPEGHGCFTKCLAVKVISGQLIVEGGALLTKVPCKVIQEIGLFTKDLAALGRNPYVAIGTTAFSGYLCYRICNQECCSPTWNSPDNLDYPRLPPLTVSPSSRGTGNRR